MLVLSVSYKLYVMFTSRTNSADMSRDMKSNVLLAFVLVNSLLVVSCGGDNESPSNNGSTTSIDSVTFSDPTEVTISGYSGDAMEPSISRDGNILFFNNLNSSELPDGMINDTNIHYAIRNSDDNFQYMGEVIGANTDDTSESNELEGVPSIDHNNKFYFIRTIDYLKTSSPDYLLSMFQADYVDGTLINITSLPNLRNDRSAEEAVPGELNFDVDIHYDGDTLYFVQGLFSGNPFPDEADIGVASKTDGVFSVNTDSAVIMEMINTDALEYAASISRDQLELYFTRASGTLETGFDFGIYIATRSSISDVWSNVRRIDAITGDVTEGPSISSDGELLYYHQKISDQFRIWVVKRE